MMKPNHQILLPLTALLLLIILNTCIVLRQNNQRNRMINLIELQDKTILNAMQVMATPSDTDAMKDFIRTYKETEKAWHELKHSLGSAASLCEETH